MITGAALTTTWRNDLYNVAASTISATVKQMVVCNMDAVPRTFYYAVTSTSSAPAAYDPTIMFNAVTLQSHETKIFGMTDVVPSGWYLQAKVGEAGGGNYVSLTVSGMENT